jgi:hypothetical protein
MMKAKLEVLPSDTIGDLKKKIQDQIGIHPTEQQLYNENTGLNYCGDQRTLCSYRIKDGITVLVCSFRPFQQKKRRRDNSQSLEWVYSVQRLGGADINVRFATPRITVRELKQGVEEEVGVPVYQQDMYLVAEKEGGGTVREDDADPVLLGNEDEVATSKPVILSVTDAFCWENPFSERITSFSLSAKMSRALSLSADDTAVSVSADFHGSLFVRSKQMLKPNSGTHRFELVFTRDVCNTQDDVGLGNVMVGLTGQSYMKGLWNKSRWQSGQVETEPFFQFSCRFGFEVDTDDGIMRFFENGRLLFRKQLRLLESSMRAVIKHVPTGTGLYIAVGPLSAGVKVALASPTSGVFPPD